MRRHILAVLVAVLAIAVFPAFVGFIRTGAAERGHPDREDAVQLKAALSGKEEVPGPGDRDGSGNAAIRLDKTKACFRLDWTKIASPNAGHIHRGVRGEAGPVVVALFESDSPLPDTVSGVQGCVRDVKKTLIRAIVAHPDRFYVNLHNEQFPEGAIRGQLRN